MIVVVLYFSCHFDVVVQEGEPCIPMLPSCLEVLNSLLLVLLGIP